MSPDFGLRSQSRLVHFPAISVIISSRYLRKTVERQCIFCYYSIIESGLFDIFIGIMYTFYCICFFLYYLFIFRNKQWFISQMRYHSFCERHSLWIVKRQIRASLSWFTALFLFLLLNPTRLTTKALPWNLYLKTLFRKFYPKLQGMSEQFLRFYLKLFRELL